MVSMSLFRLCLFRRAFWTRRFGLLVAGGSGGFAIEVVVEVIVPSRGHGAEGQAGRIEFRAPRHQLGSEAGGDIWMLGGEVMLFVEVSGEIIKILPVPAAQEFPVALADGGLRDPAPVERVVRRGFYFAFEMRNKIHAVEVAGLGRQAGYPGSGGGDVERAYRVNEGLATGNGAGPRDDEGRVHAALGEHTLLAVERRVEASVPTGAAAWFVGFGNLERSTVVPDEEDESFLGEAVLL